MRYSLEDTKAFVKILDLLSTGSGILDNLSFAAKDLIDLAGEKTGCGNPQWRDTHPPATVHAICVQQLLSAGARCKGKTVTDELAYSLIGENHFYGTPLNAKTPDRVPGGSSSGSASAVACGVVDFALGTDTGGSVRVPASNCGIWGIRPTHGVVSVAGVSPLSPSFDTVGVLASSSGVLRKAASVLLSTPLQEPARPVSVYTIREAFALCDADVLPAVRKAIEDLEKIFGIRMREISMREIDREPDAVDLLNWYEIYRVLQRAEAECVLGPWVASVKPAMGPIIQESLELAHTLDRTLIASIKERRETYFRKMRSFLGNLDLLCIPTVSSPAPLKGTVIKRDHGGNDYYRRTLSLTAIAGVARLPQISMPLAEINGIPIGISLIARDHEDAFLLAAAELVEKGGSK